MNSRHSDVLTHVGIVDGRCPRKLALNKILLLCAHMPKIKPKLWWGKTPILQYLSFSQQD